MKPKSFYRIFLNAFQNKYYTEKVIGFDKKKDAENYVKSLNVLQSLKR